MDHGEEVVLWRYVGLLARVAAFFLREVHGPRVQAHLIVGDRALDDDQVLHLLLRAVGRLHLGLGDVDGCLLTGAKGALRRHSVSLVLLVGRQQEDITFVLSFLHVIRFNSLVNEIGGEPALATVLVDERTRLRHLQPVA